MRGNQSTFQTNALFLFAHQDDEVGVFQKILDEQRLGRRIVCAYFTDGVSGKSKQETRLKDAVEYYKRSLKRS